MPGKTTTWQVLVGKSARLPRSQNSAAVDAREHLSLTWAVAWAARLLVDGLRIAVAADPT